MSDVITGSLTPRRPDLDWLRVIAFVLLIYFHAAVVFLPSGIPMIQNATPSPVLQVFVAFLHEFRLALLFLISGLGVCFALKHRDARAFFRDRSLRLLVPLVFGTVILVPPMVYLEKRFTGAYQGSFLHFYTYFFVSGPYPVGHLSWHHFWFLAYLYLFCLLGLPLFLYLRCDTGRRAMSKLIHLLRHGWGLYLPVCALFVVEVSLRHVFPGFRDLIHDWASFSQWFLVFVAGFVFASSENLLDRTERLRRSSLILAAACTLILFEQFYTPIRGGFELGARDGADSRQYVWLCLIRAANVWFWLLTCLGYASRYLRREHRWLGYLNDAVYPLFCLHLPVIVAAAYIIVPLNWPVWLKYFALTSSAVILTLVCYEGARRLAWIRPLIGLKPVPTRMHA